MSQFSTALYNACLCLVFEIIKLSEFISPLKNKFLISFFKSSIPFPVFADISILLFKLLITSCDIFISRSILFNNAMYFLSFILSIITSSSSSMSLDASSINIIKSASSIFSFDFSTPIFSIISSVSLIPAVSVILIGIPSRFIYSSITSLVVPGISVTIALFSLNNALSNDDLPTLGLPIITTLRPSLIILPSSAFVNNCLILIIVLSMPSLILKIISSSTISSSSSVKSTAYSIKANTFNKYFLNSDISLERAPLLCIIADFIDNSVFAVIISITASA